MILYKIISEWDMDHEDLVFKTEESALKYARKIYDSWELEESFEEVCAGNYIYAKTVTIME